jgi:hypothetical protein
VAYDLEELKFGGMVASAVEDELSASIYDDEDRAFVREIYERYKAVGAPKNKREWIKQEIKKHFLCASKRPEWIERTTVPRWPFFQGQPMVFIDQVNVPENDVEAEKGTSTFK